MACPIRKLGIFDHHNIEQRQCTTLLQHAPSQFQQYYLSQQGNAAPVAFDFQVETLHSEQGLLLNLSWYFCLKQLCSLCFKLPALNQHSFPPHSSSICHIDKPTTCTSNLPLSAVLAGFFHILPSTPTKAFYPQIYSVFFSLGFLTPLLKTMSADS